MEPRCRPGSQANPSLPQLHENIPIQLRHWARLWQWLLPLWHCPARNAGGQSEGLIHLGKKLSLWAWTTLCHGVLLKGQQLSPFPPCLGRERREWQRDYLSQAVCPRLERDWPMPASDGPIPLPFPLASNMEQSVLTSFGR